MFRGIRRKERQRGKLLRPRIQNNRPELRFADGSIAVFGNSQHQGQRDYQEDSFGFSDTSAEFAGNNGLLAVLADGMGGLSDGKAVSERVVSNILSWFNAGQPVCSGEALKNEIALVNEEICSIFCSDGTVASGSTVVSALIKNSELHWACVGDSRIYLKRGERLYQINEDHDLLNMLLGEAIDNGTEAISAFDNPQRDSLVGCIGKSGLDSFDYSKRGFRLVKNDKILLCSDGVYNALTDSEMCALLKSEPMRSAEKIKRTVIEKRFANQDNLTAIVISVR